jgi:branched-chain amino acid transport system permease protein
MDISYLLFNTIIYGSLAFFFSIFSASGKIMNFALGNYLIVAAYILYSFFVYGFSRTTFFVLVAFVIVYTFIHWIILHYFPNDKQRDLVGLVMTLGLSVVLENAMNYVYGPNSIFLSGFSIPVWIIGLLFFCCCFACWYLFRKSVAGKILNAISENSKLVLSLGISTTSFLQKVFTVILGVLFLISFLLLTETSLRASDGLFYMIKAMGIMILVGTARRERIFAGALLYVLVEYLLFIVWGLPISYKETFILLVILGVLLFKPEGLFNRKKRNV